MDVEFIIALILIVIVIFCFFFTLIYDLKDSFYIVVIDGNDYCSSVEPVINGNTVRICVDGVSSTYYFSESVTYTKQYVRDRWWRK